MPKPSAPLGRAEAIAKKIAGEFGYELVDVEVNKEATGRFLRFYIDKPSGITLNDCETFHRRIHPLMDDIDYDYMEVSSPGADRPLKREVDFLRALHTMVEVKLYKAMDGQKVLFGILTGYEDGILTIEDEQGHEHRIDKKLTALVRPHIEFDEQDLIDELPPEDGEE